MLFDDLRVSTGPQLGYQLFPFEGAPVYVDAWFLVTFPLLDHAEPAVGGVVFELPSTNFVPGLFVGWQF